MKPADIGFHLHRLIDNLIAELGRADAAVMARLLRNEDPSYKPQNPGLPKLT